MPNPSVLCAMCGEPTTAAATCMVCEASPWLDGRYQLDRILGRSTHALTYAATERSTGIRVVAKALTLRHLPEWDAFDRFHREAAVLRELDHPAVPKCLEQLETGTGKHRSVWLIETWFDGH
ncbi:MAG: hypothetical protein AAFV29_10415, partial [Myxococcota bacterium]